MTPDATILARRDTAITRGMWLRAAHLALFARQDWALWALRLRSHWAVGSDWPHGDADVAWDCLFERVEAGRVRLDPLPVPITIVHAADAYAAACAARGAQCGAQLPSMVHASEDRLGPWWDVKADVTHVGVATISALVSNEKHVLLSSPTSPCTAATYAELYRFTELIKAIEMADTLDADMP